MVKKIVVGMCAVMMAVAALGCNRTDGACWAPGEGGAGPGSGGGPILPDPGQGGYGNVPPDPQGADDPESMPCNAVEEKIWYCNGDVVCHLPNGSTDGCHHVDTVRTGPASAGPGPVIERLVRECQDSKPKEEGLSCEQDTLSCSDKPKNQPQPAAAPHVCNGGVICVDSKDQHDGCSYVSEEVWADDEEDARQEVTHWCEVEMHDKHGNNCDHGGMCCQPGSLTCHKSPG